jgi:hypothetical protein
VLAGPRPEAYDARRFAADKIERHTAALQHMFLPLALISAVPPDADGTEREAALEATLRALFPVS